MNYSPKISWLRLSAIIVLLLMVSTSDAQIFEVTDPSLPGGNKNITLDQSTGLEWLDWSATVGLTLDQVLSETCPGGSYQGFRLATNEEARVLFTHFGLPVGNWPRESNDSDNGLAAIIAINALGKTFQIDIYPRAAALTTNRVATVSVSYFPTRNWSHTDNLASQSGLQPTQGVGFALVRRTSVESIQTCSNATPCLHGTACGTQPTCVQPMRQTKTPPCCCRKPRLCLFKRFR